jgi:hypothetical protein
MISEVLLPTMPLPVIKTNQDFHSDFIYNRYISINKEIMEELEKASLSNTEVEKDVLEGSSLNLGTVHSYI